MSFIKQVGHAFVPVIYLSLSFASSPEAHFNLAELYANSGQNALAAPEYIAALNIRPEWPEGTWSSVMT